MEALQRVLAGDARIAYALLFGSGARGTAHEGSDLDVAIAFHHGVLVDHGVIGRELAQRLRAAAGLLNLIAHQYGALNTSDE